MRKHIEVKEAVDLLTSFVKEIDLNHYQEAAHIIDMTVDDIYLSRKYYLQAVLGNMLILLTPDKYSQVYQYIKNKIFFNNPNQNGDNKSRANGTTNLSS